jgi:hypothetical protein
MGDDKRAKKGTKKRIFYTGALLWKERRQPNSSRVIVRVCGFGKGFVHIKHAQADVKFAGACGSYLVTWR